MGVAGRFFAQLFGTTLCDFGAIMRWWLSPTPPRPPFQGGAGGGELGGGDWDVLGCLF